MRYESKGLELDSLSRSSNRGTKSDHLSPGSSCLLYPVHLHNVIVDNQ